MPACLPRSIVYRYRILCKFLFNLLLARVTLMKLWREPPLPFPLLILPLVELLRVLHKGSPKMACGRGASAVAVLLLLGCRYLVSCIK